MIRIFITRHFSRWLRKSELTSVALCAAVHEMVTGLVDADLGGGLVKKRIAVPGRGKRGGTRTLLATNRQDRWFFLYGFAKNDRANVSPQELEALQSLAHDLLTLNANQLDAQVATRALEEICHDNPDQERQPPP